MAYVEIEAFIIANLLAGMESGVVGAAPIWTDAKTFDARPFHNKIHGIIGGYPCPGESLAGLRQGHLYKGFIWPSIRKAIDATRPVFCYFENVDDHLTGTYPIVQRSLRNMGYAVEAGVFAASECGASIEAQRLFILAVDETYVAGFRGFSAKGFQPETFHASGKVVEANNSNGRLAEREQGQKWKREIKDIDTFRTNKTLGPTIDSRFKEQRIERTQQPRITHYPSFEEFPQGQGPGQYEWEEPRTIESCVGYTIERYNFREDLLRANGNMVPEQQSELAFIHLMHKHGLESFII